MSFRPNEVSGEIYITKLKMIKKLLLTIAAVLCATSLFAQKSDWGGVKGTVANRAAERRLPVHLLPYLSLVRLLQLQHPMLTERSS
jgi:hypothetical protein